jgi:hypothetical protein
VIPVAYYGLTDEESELIRVTVVLPMVLSIVEKSKQTLESDKLGLKKLYLIATDVLTSRIRSEIDRVKKELWKSQIKVFVSNPAVPYKIYRRKSPHAEALLGVLLCQKRKFSWFY